MSTYSSNLYIELIGTGEQTGTWGSTTNNNFQYVFEEAIVGRATVAFSDADVTLTPVAATTNQTFRNVYLNCTGTNTASRNLIVPTINKNYIVENNTTGGFNIVVKTAAGTGITVPNGYKCAVYVDGTNVVTAFSYLGGGLTVTNLTDSALTSGRVTFAGTGGLLSDSANLTWNGTTLAVVGRLYNGDASTFGASTWGMSLGNGGASANYFKASTTYWQDNAGNAILQLSSSGLNFPTAASGNANISYDGSTFTLVSNSSSASMVFSTNSTERGRFTSGGLFGLGTNNPQTSLQINAAAPTIRIEETTTGGSKRLEMGVTSGGVAFIGANQSAQSLTFQTVGAEVARFTPTGQFIIGNTSTSYNMQLYVGGSNSSILQFASGVTGAGAANGLTVGMNNSGQAVFIHQQGYSLLFGSNGAASMTLDSSNNLILGTSPGTASQQLTFNNSTGGLGIGWGATSSNYTNIFGAYSSGALVLAVGVQGNRSSDAYTSSYAGSIYRSAIRIDPFNGTGIQFFVNSSATTVAVGSAVSLTEVGRFSTNGYLGVGTASPDSVICFAGNITSKGSDNYGIGTNGGNNHFNVFATGASGAVRFFTGGSSATAAGGGGAERARIDSNGRMQIGTTSSLYSATLTLLSAGNSYNLTSSRVGAGTGTLGHVVFENDNGAVGTIQTNGSSTIYNTSSDYRLKNITGPITNSGSYIDSLNPVEGTWKVDGAVFVGLVAHEAQEISRTPVATGVKDGEEMQGMDYGNSEFIANIIAELQSLRKRVAQLEQGV